MKYFQILASCSTDLESCCSDYGIATYLYIVKKVLTLIQIVVPIILIVMGTIQLVKMMTNPDDKGGKEKKNFLNKFVAAIIVFFIPVVVNILIGIMPDSFELSNCWKSAENIVENTINGSTKYDVTHTDERTKISQETGKVDAKKNKKSSSSSNKNNLSSSNDGSGLSYLENYNQNKYSNKMCSSGCSSVISSSGCSASSYSAAIYLLTGKKVNIVKVANKMCSVGAYICGAGGNGTKIVGSKKLKKSYGVSGEYTKRSYSNFVKQLKAGHVILVSVRNGSQNDRNGSTGFNATSNGHYILLADYRESDGTIYVYNPNGNRNSGYRTREDIDKYIVNVGGTGSWYLKES